MGEEQSAQRSPVSLLLLRHQENIFFSCCQRTLFIVRCKELGFRRHTAKSAAKNKTILAHLLYNVNMPMAVATRDC